MKASADEEGVKTLIFQKSPRSPILYQFPWTFELEEQEWRWLEKCKLVLSFVFRHLFVRIHIWDKEGMSVSSHHLSDYAVSYFLHGLLKTFSLRCTETAAPATSIFVYYLCMYCIDKVQSLLLHKHHFELHINHWDKLCLRHTGIRSRKPFFGPSLSVKAPTFNPAPVNQLLCDAFHGEKRFPQWPEKSVSRCYLVSHLSSHHRWDITLFNPRWHLVLQHWHNQLRSLSVREVCKIYTQEGIC